MRIRRKKHLKERLQSVNNLIVAERDIVNVKEAIKDKRYLSYEKIFNNDNPVELEIGCGKGGFIIEKAIKNPSINYIAVEMLENIIVMACEKAIESKINNVVFFNTGAEYLQRYIRENSIQNVYLNFSPPYPADSYENRRLTCVRNIEAYKSFLVDGGCVYQKTDDKPFFDYSMAKFAECGFRVENISDELNSGKIDNVQTEYEKKFRAQGLEVFGLIARK